MDFALHADETVLEGLQRIARAELAAAIHDVEHPAEAGVPESVHDLRKRCKQLRALARLGRDAIGEQTYHRSNQVFRDAARELSAVRDAQILVEVLDRLLADADDARGEATIDAAPMREALVARYDAVTESVGRDGGPFERARARLAEGGELIETWRVDDDFEALAGGLRRTYRRARTGFRRCLGEPTTAELHDWRKRAKYHWYHLRVLSPALPELLEPWAEAVHELSDLLGDDHDLAVLAGTVAADPLAHGGGPIVEQVCGLVEQRRAALQASARRQGLRVSAEHPEAVVARLALWWEAWRAEAGDDPAGQPRSAGSSSCSAQRK